jgi:hypothetical protein
MVDGQGWRLNLKMHSLKNVKRKKDVDWML